MDRLIVWLLAFVIIQAEFADGTKTLIRMDDKTGLTWVFVGTAENPSWKEIGDDPLFGKRAVPWVYRTNEPEK